jgi:hypothetical protein
MAVVAYVVAPTHRMVWRCVSATWRWQTADIRRGGITIQAMCVATADMLVAAVLTTCVVFVREVSNVISPKKIEQLRSDAVMAMYLSLAEQGKLEGDVIHVGGSIWVNIKGLGKVKIVVMVEEDSR